MFIVQTNFKEKNKVKKKIKIKTNMQIRLLEARVAIARCSI